MRIAVLSSGSRGDIQPYIALALRLKDDRHVVHFCTPCDHVQFCEDMGFTATPCGPSSAGVVKSDPSIRKAQNDADLAAAFHAFAGPDAMKAFEEFFPHMIKTFKQFQPDLVVCGTMMTMWGIYAQHVLQLPVVIAIPFFAYPSKMRSFYGLPHLACGLSAFPTEIMLVAFHHIFQRLDAIFRKLTGVQLVTGGGPMPLDTFVTSARNPALPTLVFQSPQVAAVIYPDAPRNVVFTGSWVVPKDRQRGEFFNSSASTLIDSFLSKGSAVYMGWGSLICDSAEHMVRIAVGALKEVGARGIILGGGAELSLELLVRAEADSALISYAEDHVLFLQKAPHALLFPRMSCLVHHGGAGTTNASLLAGVPQV